MAPLSKELAGIILPHDSFGSHLNASGVTIDDDLELKNFRKAGEILGEIWSNTEVDGHKVSAKWFDPMDDSASFKAFTDRKIGADWLDTHVRISKYCLEIAKCGNDDCCTPLRTNVQTILRGKFLPVPLSMGKF